MVSFQDAPGAGFTPVPSLERLVPDSGPARLAVSVHRLPWGLGAYMTEACDMSDRCAMLDGDEQRTLEQRDSVAASGYFKAPKAGVDDWFGHAVALSRDGSVLAVGAPGEDSASTGTFAPGDVGYQTVLNNSDSTNSGAVTVYRRSEGKDWEIEAFVKAPKAGDGDNFGWALALSADGSALAAGAPGEDSSATGAFAPGAPGYQDALDSAEASTSGAAYVYRRSGSEWSLEAFVKAPKAGGGDQFGSALALSGDGTALAVGSPGEDSASTGTFAPGGAGYQTALDSEASTGSGAVTVYRRSERNDWEIEAFVKAPNADAFDEFGFAVALSEDSSTLAVGAPFEESASTGTFAPGDAGYQAALDDNSVHSVSRYNLDHNPIDSGSAEFLEAEVGIDAGSAYVYRRSGADGLWTVEAFVKAPKAGADDLFGYAVALSADGDTLAAGAPLEGSSHTGVFAPTDAGYQAALDSDGADASGAVISYRRSEGKDWEIEAFVKAPKAGVDDEFGYAVALSADGAALAVGAPFEESASTGVFILGDTGYQAALDSGDAPLSGGATVYLRSGAGGLWTLEAFVKAPNAGDYDNFGEALALSGDGGALAVGASHEDGGALLQPVGGGSADAGNAVEHSGAAYLY